MNIKRFIKKADWSSSGGTGTGLFPTDTSLGFGYSGSTEGLGQQTNLPPSHQGHSGNLDQGPWAGDSICREPHKSEFVMKTIDDFTPEQLIQEIRSLMKIDTPESQSKAVYLKRILDDKMRRLKAAHEAYRTLNTTKKADIVNRLKQDSFVIALFAEHNLPLSLLEKNENIPEETTHFALHKMVHSLLKTSQEVSDVVEEFEVAEEDLEGLTDEELQEWGLKHAKLQEEIDKIVQDLKKSPIDQWTQILSVHRERIGEETFNTILNMFNTGYRVAYEKRPFAEVWRRHQVPDIGMEPLDKEQLQEFYAIGTMVDLLEYAPSGFIKHLVENVNLIAHKMLKAIRYGASAHLTLDPFAFVNIEMWDAAKNSVGSIDAFLSRVSGQSVSMEELVKFGKGTQQTDTPWYKLAEAAAVVEKMMPANAGNLAEFVMALDHLLDLEHYNGAILGSYVPVVDKNNDSLDTEELQRMMTSKSRDWTMEDIKEKAPNIYNMLHYLKTYRRAKVKRFLEAQTTSQPFKGKCPESGKTRYMTHTEYVQNDFRANCPEGKRPLEDVKSISIEEFKKKRKQKRKKKKAELDSKIVFSQEEQKVIEAVKKASEELGIKCYLVGGAVRDKLLGKENSDMDFMCEDRAEELVAHLAQKYSTKDPIKYDRSQAMMLTLGEQAVDFINAERLFVPLREEETLEGDEEFTTSFDDAYRRDLTINTLMYDIVEERLVDPTKKGLGDLRGGVINTVIDPFIKFKIHAADMLRALRFAATLDFELGPKMLEAMKANAHRVIPRDHGGDISNRRIRRELRKAIDTPEHWAKMRQLLSEAGLDIVLADDIQDVQDDFEGGIDYKFEEHSVKEGDMRIKRFTKNAGIFDLFKKKEESTLPALDKWLEKQDLKKPTSPKSVSVQPATKEERLQYISKRLDEKLKGLDSRNQRSVLDSFLAEYKIVSGTPEYSKIISMLKNFKPMTITPNTQEPHNEKDVWRD